MTTTDPDLSQATSEDLLGRVLNTATATPDRLTEGLNRLERDQLIAVLALAAKRLIEPGRVGQLDDLAGDMAEVMFDDAHEHCDSDGCTGGGKPYYDSYVKEVLMPVVRRYAVVEEVKR